MRLRCERGVTATFHELGRALVVASCVHGGWGGFVKAGKFDNQTTIANFTTHIACISLYPQVQPMPMFRYAQIPSPHTTRFMFRSTFWQLNSDWPAVRHTFPVDDMAGQDAHGAPSSPSTCGLSHCNTYSFKGSRLANPAALDLEDFGDEHQDSAEFQLARTLPHSNDPYQPWLSRLEFALRGWNLAV
jgi:hypothetical protein